MEVLKTFTKWYKLPLEKALVWAKKIIKETHEIVHPLPQTLKTYFNLCQSCKKAKNHFDLYLAATLIDNEIEVLVTNDKSGFEGVKKLQVFSLTEF